MKSKIFSLGVWQKYFWLVLDTIITPSREVALARRLTEDELSKLLNPRPLPDLPWVTSLFPYANPKIRALIKAIKYNGETIVLKQLGRLVAEELLLTLGEKQLFSGWDRPCLVPIPTSHERMRERGYNQTARITESILKYLPDVAGGELLNRQNRESQVRIPKEKRRENIRGAFFVEDATKIHARHIVLIDDVVESGATLEDARRALMEAGAADVIAVAIAH